MHELEDWTIVVARGRLDWQEAEEIVTFWTSSGRLGEAAARARLPEVVCLLRDKDGAVAGVNSVYETELPLVGGRRFWIYRAADEGIPAATRDGMLTAAFDALLAEFDPAGPVGLCVLVEDRAERRRRPEAVWHEPRMFYAGYLDDGRQVRVAYFPEARIGA
jgi:hypothetical protein